MALSDSENPKLSKAIDRWAKGKQKLSKNERDNRYRWYKEFIRAFGDRRINEYKMSDARETAEALDKLPPRYQDLMGYKRLNFVEAARKAASEARHPMTAYNVDKKLGWLKGLWVSTPE